MVCRKTRTRRKSRRGGRRTKRRTRRRTRRRPRRGGRRRRRRQRGGAGAPADDGSVEEPEKMTSVAGAATPQQGGRRKRKSQKGGKRKMNAFFKQMLAAKRAGKTEFTYTKKGGKSQRYVGRKHARLGMVYRKA